MAGTERSPRSVALDVLRKLDGGAFAQFVLQEETHRARLDRRDTRFVWELALGAERWRGRLDDALRPLLRRGVEKTDPLVLTILRLGAYQLLFMDRVPDHAAIHSTVELTKSRRGEGPARFVNGVLRSLLRRGYTPPPAETADALSIRESHPLWLVERYIERGGFADAEARCHQQNMPARLTIRCRQESDRDAVRTALESEGATVTNGLWSTSALHLEGHPNPFQSPSFLEGRWVVQDESSQLTVELLGSVIGASVWDVCAAPGGKSRGILDRMSGQGHLLATDINTRKLKRLADELDDSAECLVHDGRSPLDGRQPFDRVLLDAPCTALGLVRRHPEIRWRRSAQDIGDRATLQKKMLTNVANHVRPGGILVYSVCSDTPEEGPDQVAHFLAERGDFTLDAPEGAADRWPTSETPGIFQLFPHRHGCDGFFAARMRRKENR